MITKDIYEILKNDSRITYFTITEDKCESCELYFVHEKLETVRHTNTTDKKVTIRVDHDGFVGSTSFLVYANATKESLKEDINKAYDKCLLINNKYYDAFEGCKSLDTLDSNFKDKSLSEVAEEISNVVFKSNITKTTTINALEIFVKKHENHLIGTNLDRKVIFYDAEVEAIPTYTQNNDSVELYEFVKMSSLDEASLLEEINSKLQDVEARFSAKTHKLENIGVALRAHELETFFNELASNLSYFSKYSNFAIYQIGDNFQSNPKKDKITFSKVASIKGSSESLIFDAEGVTVKDKKLIDNGKVVGNYGSLRYAKYLGADVTGVAKCTLVECGNTSIKDFKEPYFECASMSGLQVDINNDYIGGEVRLGYLHQDGKKIPVTGVSISGKISEVFNSVTLSKESKLDGGYLGPELALFDGFSIL